MAITISNLSWASSSDSYTVPADKVSKVTVNNICISCCGVISGFKVSNGDFCSHLYVGGCAAYLSEIDTATDGILMGDANNPRTFLLTSGMSFCTIGGCSATLYTDLTVIEQDI